MKRMHLLPFLSLQKSIPGDRYGAGACKVGSKKNISSSGDEVRIDKEKIKMLRISPNLLNDFGVLIG